ncbi:hypothetical protein FRC03_012100 [Tulasnella sp. 419]|nr:hypothetical protein FRC03_012100 [Tulasnella sp. 419]
MEIFGVTPVHISQLDEVVAIGLFNIQRALTTDIITVRVRNAVIACAKEVSKTVSDRRDVSVSILYSSIRLVQESEDFNYPETIFVEKIFLANRSQRSSVSVI